MNTNREAFCIVMGGGRGNRMMPLTAYRSKPAVPLGGRYRIIDVPISNCLNSGFNRILVLTQFNSESLNKHILRTYRLDTFSGGYVEILAAEQSNENAEWFQGTADSVRRSLSHIHDPRIKEVFVLSGDQLYAMDLRVLQEEHRMNDADITVACHPVPARDVKHFGIMNIDENDKIISFIEKPSNVSKIPGKPVDVGGKPHYLANMGIYIFKESVLKDILSHTPLHDFGKEIIPDAIKTHRVCAYVFDGYWSDIGTVKSYYQASLMLTDPVPPFNIYNEGWQFYTRPRYLPPAKMLRCRIEESIIAEGCIIDEAIIKKCVVGVRSLIGNNTVVERSVLNGNDYYDFDRSNQEKRGSHTSKLGIGKDCEIRCAIIDKNVAIGDRVRILNKKKVKEYDGKTYSIRDGIVVVHKHAVIPDDTVI